MKRFNITAIVKSVSIVLPGIVFGQSAKEAVRALKKLEARFQVGISYKDYKKVALGSNLQNSIYKYFNMNQIMWGQR